jgi:hypothetical protein
VSVSMWVEIATAAVILALIAHYSIERHIIRKYAAGIAHEYAGLDPFNTALAICSAVLRRTHHLADDRSFVGLPLFRSLGSTPVGVIRHGGCCSGKSRLVVVALNSLGISAAQATLYHASGRAQHCLVEVNCHGGPILMDPMYGLYFVDGHGGPVGIAALRGGTQPVLKAIPGSVCASYPDNDYYNFDLHRTGTANWTKSPARRLAYRLASCVAPGRIDQVRQPACLEWPQLLIAWPLLVVLLAVHVVAHVSNTRAAAMAQTRILPSLPSYLYVCVGCVVLATLAPSLSLQLARIPPIIDSYFPRVDVRLL